MNELTDLVARASEGPPQAGLAAVAQLRELVDRWEEDHVRSARREGWAWAEIARVLGRHRQAVHREYARRLSGET
ncbi:MAG: helix-turn-helix domain-containing protein [Acidimicrobiales bacterium]